MSDLSKEQGLAKLIAKQARREIPSDTDFYFAELLCNKDAEGVIDFIVTHRRAKDPGGFYQGFFELSTNTNLTLSNYTGNLAMSRIKFWEESDRSNDTLKPFYYKKEDRRKIFNQKKYKDLNEELYFGFDVDDSTKIAQSDFCKTDSSKLNSHKKNKEIERGR